MRYNNYKEWVKYIETEYKKRGKRSVGGFQAWINKLVSDNAEIKKDFDAFVEYRQTQKEPNYYAPEKNHKLENDMPDFIANVISQSFYKDELPDDKWGHKEYRRVTAFNHDQNNWKDIKNWCSGKDPAQLPITDINPFCSWVIICSAFQKKYSIFCSLEDLNKFVFSVGGMKNPKGIQNYGFYVRDIRELCLAYSILHGYSVVRFNNLYIQCQEMIQSSPIFTTAKATRTEECSGYFKNDLTVNEVILSSEEELCKCEKDFIDNVKKHADIFLKENDRKEKFAHWTALKNLLFDFTNMLSSGESIQKLDEGIVQTLWQNFADILDLNPDILKSELGKFFAEESASDDIGEKYAEISKKTLQGYLVQRLGLFNFCFLSNNISSLYNLHLDIADSGRQCRKLENDIVKLEDELRCKINDIIKKYNISRVPFEQFRSSFMDYFNETAKYEEGNNKEKLEIPAPPKFDSSQFEIDADLYIQFEKDIKCFMNIIKKIFNSQNNIRKIERRKRNVINKIEGIRKAIKSIIDDSLRCILIVCIVKDGIEKGWNSVESVLYDINQTLIDNKLRGIDSKESPSDGEVYNEEKDMFDWVIAEAINLEYVEQQEKQRKTISGYEIFRKYLLDGIGGLDAEMSLTE